MCVHTLPRIAPSTQANLINEIVVREKKEEDSAFRAERLTAEKIYAPH